MSVSVYNKIHGVRYHPQNSKRLWSDRQYFNHEKTICPSHPLVDILGRPGGKNTFNHFIPGCHSSLGQQIKESEQRPQLISNQPYLNTKAIRGHFGEHATKDKSDEVFHSKRKVSYKKVFST